MFTVRRLLPWIALSVVVAAGAAYGISESRPKKYIATAALLLRASPSGEQIVGLSGGPANESQTTNVRLVSLGDMAEKTAHALGLQPADVRAAVSVAAQGQSNVIDVAATAASPRLAQEIANRYARLFVAEEQARSHALYAAVRKSVDEQLGALSAAERAGPVGSELKRRVRTLGVLKGTHEGPAQLVQAAALPASASSPKALRNAVLTAVLALLLGLVAALLLGRLDRRIRRPEDLGRIYRLPLLGIIPQSKGLARASQPGSRAGRELLPAREAEALHLIRAHLRYLNVERDLRTLLVSSPASGEGKTTVARHLAVAAASVGQTVLLLEADLRDPCLARQLGIASGPGVADVTIGSVSLWRATQPVAIDPPVGAPQGPLALDVLVAGWMRPAHAVQLFESPAMSVMLEQAKEAYDLVVLDSTSPLVASDAFPLLRVVDGVVLVGRIGRDRRAAEQLQETLGSVGAPVIGVIANGVKARRPESHSEELVFAAGDEPEPSGGAMRSSVGRAGTPGDHGEQLDGSGVTAQADGGRAPSEPVSGSGC